MSNLLAIRHDVTIVAKTGIKREPSYLYFLRGNVVFKKPVQLVPGGPTTERVCVADFVPEEGRVYYLDTECNVVAHNDVQRGET